MALSVLGTTNNGNHTFSVTTPANTNLLVVTYSFRDITASDRLVSGVTFDGVAMTRATTLDATNSNVSSGIWYLVNPGVKTADVVITVGGAIGFSTQGAVYFSGADTSSPIGNNNVATGSGTAIANSISTTVGNVVVDAVASENSTGLTVDASQTAIYSQVNSARGRGASYETAAGASTSMDWTILGNQWCSTAVEIKAAVGGTVPRSLGAAGSLGLSIPTTGAVSYGSAAAMLAEINRLATRSTAIIINRSNLRDACAISV